MQTGWSQLSGHRFNAVHGGKVCGMARCPFDFRWWSYGFHLAGWAKAFSSWALTIGSWALTIGSWALTIGSLEPWLVSNSKGLIVLLEALQDG